MMFQLLKCYRFALILFYFEFQCVFVSFRHGKIHHGICIELNFTVIQLPDFDNLFGVSLSLSLSFYASQYRLPLSLLSLFEKSLVSWLYGRYTLHVFDQNSLCRNVQYQNACVWSWKWVKNRVNQSFFSLFKSMCANTKRLKTNRKKLNSSKSGATGLGLLILTWFGYTLTQDTQPAVLLQQTVINPLLCVCNVCNNGQVPQRNEKPEFIRDSLTHLMMTRQFGHPEKNTRLAYVRNQQWLQTTLTNWNEIQ